ncbi:MAG TPA: hypothetical protein VGD04_05785, partial [Methylophilus sp.]
TSVCLLFATIIVVAIPFSLGTFAFACFLVFMGAALWIDYTKPLSAQNLSPAQRNLAKVAVWGLVILFVTMFVYSLFNVEVHLNGRGFVQLITALLKAL